MSEQKFIQSSIDMIVSEAKRKKLRKDVDAALEGGLIDMLFDILEAFRRNEHIPLDVAKQVGDHILKSGEYGPALEAYLLAPDGAECAREAFGARIHAMTEEKNYEGVIELGEFLQEKELGYVNMPYKDDTHDE